MPEPGSSIDVDGVTYSVDENGRASYTTEGTTGLPAGGEMDFIDYSTADGERPARLRAVGADHGRGRYPTAHPCAPAN